MHIKNIIISGFRSYREQSFPEGLATGVNTIVGKNGSGKSNFFSAIQFVLNDKLGSVRVSDRRDLLHLGSGRPTLSVIVEVVLDNSDGRLVIPGRGEEAEVRIRRTMGLKQDDFRVNDRKFSAEDVYQLLESAGFSSSNPYYIVEQGKIAHLASMSERERYELLKEVAGTQLYENRRAESKQILSSTQEKQLQLDALIDELGRRLHDLEGETSELKQMQQIDQEKKCVEYCILNAELEGAKVELAQLEAEWKSRLDEQNSGRESEQLLDEEISTATHRLNAVTNRIGQMEAEKRAVEEQLGGMIDREAVVELETSEAATTGARSEQERHALEVEATQVQRELASAQSLLQRRRSDHLAREERFAAAASASAQAEAQLNTLQERRNRKKLFKSQEERDAWIDKDLSRCKDTLARCVQERSELKAELDKMEQQIASAYESLAQIQACDMPEGSAAVNRRDCALPSPEDAARMGGRPRGPHDARMREALQHRDALNQRRRDLWKQAHDQERAVQRAEEELRGARQQMERASRFDIRQGTSSLDAVLNELNDPALRAAVHGPLISLIDIEDGYALAADITAGNSLFNIVVDSFDVSARLLEHMNRRQMPGRISFFPLDTCKGIVHNIPTTVDSTSLLSKIKYDQRFHSVVAEVFGRTAVVATLEAGAKVVKELRCDAVTVEGDQLNVRGGITGGYIDNRNVKLSLYARQTMLQQRAGTERNALQELNQHVASVEQEIVEALNRVEALRSEGSAREREAEARQRELREVERRVERLLSARDNLCLIDTALSKNITESEAMIALHEAEREEKFTTSWTADDEHTLEKLAAETMQRKSALTELQSGVVQSATEVQLHTDTVKHLQDRLNILNDRVAELGWSNRAKQDMNDEHTTMRATHAELSEQLQSLNDEINNLERERFNAEANLEGLNTKRLLAMKSAEARQYALDVFQTQRTVMMQKRDDAMYKIRQLGAMPAAVAQYAPYSMGKLMHNLKMLNERLQRYSYVNRKAVDQHSALLTSKNDLQAQRDALAREFGSIQELIEHLDCQKDEAVERTYKQIQYQFELVFKELVASEDCVAELKLVKSEVPVAQGDDRYTGVRIHVSFGAGFAVSELEQLSGGQKSLVALALIFAIQRCDPAPFYLFDEIDAALDSEYRASVAKMIKKQSEGCQFIVASFKTEMIHIADKVLGIFFHNKVSRIQTIAPEEGVQLLKQAALEERHRVRDAL